MNEPLTTTEIPSATPALAQRRAPRWLIVIVACLFAGLIPETVLTSSTSVLTIVVNPLSPVYLAIFYGTFMLLVREAIIRKPASWLSVLLLGIAFGFCNEGVVAGTWYTVQNKGYLFFGPVDVAWAVGLTVFHTFISVITTVAFTDVLFPAYAGKSLLGRGGIRIAAALFTLFTALALFAPTFRLERILVFGAALVLAVIALRLPPAPRRQSNATVPPRLWSLRLAGFFGYLLYFAFLYFIPLVTAGLPHNSLANAQFMDIALMLGFAALVFARGVGWLRTTGWGLRQNAALMTGPVAFEALISLLPGQIALLEPVATVSLLIFLIVRSGQLQRRSALVAAAAESA